MKNRFTRFFLKFAAQVSDTAWDSHGNHLGKIVKILAVLDGPFGGWDWIITLLFKCMIADCLSGLCVAGMGKSLQSKNGGLSSKVGVYGLLRKGLMLSVFLVAAMPDKTIGVDDSDEDLKDDTKEQ